MRANSSSVRVGFVGSGYMAREHARAFSGLASLVGVVSRNSKNASTFAREFNIEFSTSRLKEFFQRVNPDLVVVAVPELQLPSVLQQCFQYPAVFLVEKPIGTSLEVSTVVTDLVHDNGASAFVAFNRRHYSSTQIVIASLADQERAVRLIQVLDQEDQLAARCAGQPEDVVKNWMYANSIHVVDLITLFGRGDVTSIKVTDAWNPREPGFVSGAIRFTSGDRATYQAVWNAPGPWSCAVTTPTTRYEMRPLEKLWIQKSGSRSPVEAQLDPVDQDFKPGLRRQAEEAIQAVEGRSHCLPTFEDSLVSMRLVAALYGLVDR